MTIGSGIAAFFAGAFLSNFVPHYVKGVCGDGFPTPFSKPSGIGLSSPLVNVVWALANLAAAFFLFRAGHVASGEPGPLGVFFAGLALLSLQHARHFPKKHKE